MMREWAIQVFGKWLKIPMVAEEKGEIMGAVHSVGPHQVTSDHHKAKHIMGCILSGWSTAVSLKV